MHLAAFVQIVQPVKNLPPDFDQVDRITVHILGKVPFRAIVHNDKGISTLQPVGNGMYQEPAFDQSGFKLHDKTIHQRLAKFRNYFP